MRALTATIRILLDPKVIGPEGQEGWNGGREEDAAFDYVSEVLTFQQTETILDWAYEPHDPAWQEIEIDRDSYEEGDFLMNDSVRKAQEMLLADWYSARCGLISERSGDISGDMRALHKDATDRAQALGLGFTIELPDWHLA